MTHEKTSDDVVVKEVHAFSFPVACRATGGVVSPIFVHDGQSWTGSVSVHAGTKFQIQFNFYNHYQSHYYLLLVNHRNEEEGCVFHAVANQRHVWDTSQSHSNSRPKMDMVFYAAGGYVNKSNISFKIFIEASVGILLTVDPKSLEFVPQLYCSMVNFDLQSAFRWTLPLHHTPSSPVLSQSQVPLSALLTGPKNALVQAMQEMYKNHTSCDIAIQVEGTTNIKAHKVVLVAMSSVFDKMLEGGMKEAATKRIVITDFSGPAVKAFIDYLYYQELSPSDSDKWAADLWGLGDKYNVQSLQRHVVQRSAQFVTLKNVINVLMRADLHGAIEIKKSCLGYMVMNAKAIAKQEKSVRSLPKHLLQEYVLEYGN